MANSWPQNQMILHPCKLMLANNKKPFWLLKSLVETDESCYGLDFINKN